jgi:hypothetical protein
VLFLVALLSMPLKAGIGLAANQAALLFPLFTPLTQRTRFLYAIITHAID